MISGFTLSDRIKTNSVSRIHVYGDWDADGFVSTALLVYSQEKLGQYPLKTNAIIFKKPIEPEKFRYIFNDLNKQIDLLVFLDIPFTDSIGRILGIIKNHFSVKHIMYVDHHLSTFNNRELLLKNVDTLIVDTSKPTCKIIHDILVENNLNIQSRLKAFVDVITYMDTGRRIPSNYMKLFDLIKSFSKALNITRDPDLWIRIVDWLVEPIAVSQSDLVESVKRIVDKYEREMNDLALDLAITSVKIGDFKFIDARSKWRRRGASALASKLAGILKSHIILWIDTRKDYTILIIKASSGKAYKLGEYLVKEKIAIDSTGHPNLAIVKIPRSVSKEELLETLHKVIYYL